MSSWQNAATHVTVYAHASSRAHFRSAVRDTRIFYLRRLCTEVADCHDLQLIE